MIVVVFLLTFLLCGGILFPLYFSFGVEGTLAVVSISTIVAGLFTYFFKKMSEIITSKIQLLGENHKEVTHLSRTLHEQIAQWNKDNHDMSSLIREDINESSKLVEKALESMNKSVDGQFTKVNERLIQDWQERNRELVRIFERQEENHKVMVTNSVLEKKETTKTLREFSEFVHSMEGYYEQLNSSFVMSLSKLESLGELGQTQLERVEKGTSTFIQEMKSLFDGKFKEEKEKLVSLHQQMERALGEIVKMGEEQDNRAAHLIQESHKLVKDHNDVQLKLEKQGLERWKDWQDQMLRSTEDGLDDQKRLVEDILESSNDKWNEWINELMEQVGELRTYHQNLVEDMKKVTQQVEIQTDATKRNVEITSGIQENLLQMNDVDTKLLQSLIR